MKRFGIVASFLVSIVMWVGLGVTCTLARNAQAAEVYLGTITSTASSSKDNTNTAVPFTIPASYTKVGVVCDVAVYLLNSSTATTAATSTAVPIAANTWWDTSLTTTYRYLATLSQATGTSNCKVYWVTGRN